MVTVYVDLDYTDSVREISIRALVIEMTFYTDPVYNVDFFCQTTIILRA